MLSLLKKREPSNRAGLIATKAAAADALQVVADRRETLTRLQKVDDDANDLARIAADAAREATASRQRWVANGCLENARSHHAAGETANKAASAAQLAAADSAAARKGLPAAESALRSAEDVLQRCNRKIDEAIGLIQVGQFKETLEEFRRVCDRRHALHLELRGFLEGASSAEACRQVRETLEQCQVKEIPDYAATAQGTNVSRPPDAVMERARQWRTEAQELRGG